MVPIGGYQIALLDPTTHEPIMSHLYYQDPSDGLKTESLIYPEMLNDLGKVSQRRYIAVTVAFAIDLMNYPSADFAQWLASVGGALDGWKQFIGFTGSPGQCSYICIGALGLMPGNAIESFAAATDWADQPWASTTDVSATALLYAQSDLSFAGPRSFRSLAAPATA